MKTLQSKLDREDLIPDDVPHWIVEMHSEFDDRDLTPLAAVRRSVGEMRQGHCWLVTHVRSGLTFSVDLGRGEVVEVVDTRCKNDPDQG